MVEKYMQEFAREMGLPFDRLKLGPSDYVLPLEENLAVKITALPVGFSFSCETIPCPKEGQEALFTKLLYGNLFGRATHGAAIGLNSEGNLLTLSKSVEYTADYKQFKELLQDFMNVIDFWRQEVTNVI